MVSVYHISFFPTRLETAIYKYEIHIIHLLQLNGFCVIVYMEKSDGVSCMVFNISHIISFVYVNRIVVSFTA